MKILVSNDDGVHADGIRILSEALRQIADVVVVAPDRNHSGASHSLTLENPLRLESLAHSRRGNRGSAPGIARDGRLFGGV